MRANDPMKDLLKNSVNTQELKPVLAEILNDGFSQQEEYLFLNKFLKERRVPSIEEVGDETGVEVFVNSFHTDDYINVDHLEQALAFARALKNYWVVKHDALLNSRLILVLAVTEFGVNVKIFQSRVSQKYLTDDLNEYQQPILVIEIVCSN